MLHEGWLERLGAQGAGVLVLLALAADRQGASYYGRARMAQRLGLPPDDVDEGLRRLLALGLVAHRPWRSGDRDGVWQLLPLPSADDPRRVASPRGATSIAAVLTQLGFPAPIRTRPPESRGS